jgi:hypothetical protein
VSESFELDTKKPVNFEWACPETKIEEAFEGLLTRLVHGEATSEAGTRFQILTQVLETGVWDPADENTRPSKAFLYALAEQVDRMARPRERLLRVREEVLDELPDYGASDGGERGDRKRGAAVVRAGGYAIQFVDRHVKRAQKFVVDEWSTLFGPGVTMSEKEIAKRFSGLLAAIREGLAERLHDFPAEWRRTFLLEVATALPRARISCPRGAIKPGATCERCGASGGEKHRLVRTSTLSPYGGRDGEGGAGLCKFIRDALPPELEPYTRLAQLFDLLRAGMYPLRDPDLRVLKGRHWKVLDEFFYGFGREDIDGRTSAEGAFTKEYLEYLVREASRPATPDDGDDFGPPLIAEPKVALLIECVVLPFLEGALNARSGLPRQRDGHVPAASQAAQLAVWAALLFGEPQPWALGAALSQRTQAEGAGVRDAVALAAGLDRPALQELETGQRFASPEEVDALERALELQGQLEGLRAPDLAALWGLGGADA